MLNSGLFSIFIPIQIRHLVCAKQNDHLTLIKTSTEQSLQMYLRLWLWQKYQQLFCDGATVAVVTVVMVYVTIIKIL